MEDLEIREDIRKKLDKIHRGMVKLEPVKRAAFLSSKIEQWDQKIQNDRSLFKNLLAKGELNIDPETFEIELDEERWGLGMLQLWMLELENPDDSERDISTQSEDTSDNNRDRVEDPFTEIRQDGLWNIKQVAKYLSLGVDYLYQLTRKDLIPHIKISNRVLFRKDEIDQWVQEKHS